MNRLLRRAVRRWWAGEAGLPGALMSAVATPVEWLFRAGVAYRNRRYDRLGGTRVEGVAVVSLGNLSVGGTGKTPIAAWTARLLADADAHPALVARGYGRDELLLHQRWNPDVPVVANPDRVEAVRTARAQGAEVVVLDDGFQHRRLARDVDLVLLAAADPYPGRLLPRGPFRELPLALKRAHGVIVTRRTAPPWIVEALMERLRGEHPHLRLGLVSLTPEGWQTLAGEAVEAPAGDLLCATGVARPRAFALQVRTATRSAVELLDFPDHHEFTEADAKAIRERAGARTVAVTEKDAVKLQAYEALLPPVRVMVTALRWEEGEADIAGLVTSVLSREG